MKLSIVNLLLVLIIALFLFTRLYKIMEIPASVYWDEASIGYNAYAISETGRDEWGEFLPIHFRAFGEFKLPVYIYSVAAFVKIFGLNEFSVRFPAVLFSLGTVILTYLLAKRLSGNVITGILSSFLISISPWFFIFSRTGYEATAGLMFYLLGIYLFMLIKERNFLLIFAVISFILSMYSYNGFRIIVPLTLIILAVIYYDKLVYNRKLKILILSNIALLLLSLVPIIKLIRTDNGAVRLQAVSIQSGQNKAEFLVKFSQNYLSHFNPIFLFVNGDKNIRSQQASFGQLFLPELILLLPGFWYMLKSKSKYRLLPIMLLLLGPIPAAITKESPHALRAISMIPFISIISGFGVAQLQEWIKKKLVYGAVLIVFLGFFVNYFLSFLNTYPLGSLIDWQYEYKKIYIDFKKEIDRSDKILISDKFAQPYIFTLFYLKYDPQKFRQEVIRSSSDQWGFSTVKQFGRFEFGKYEELISFQ